MQDKIAIKKNHGALLRRATSFLKRFHLLLFFIFVVACLSYGIIFISKTINNAAPLPPNTQDNDQIINSSTLDTINSLHPSSAPLPAPSLSGERINPFSE